MEDPNVENIQVHCNPCGGMRNHHLRAEHKDFRSVEDEQNSFYWERRYQVLECAGCGEVSFCYRKYFSEWEWTPDDDGWSEKLFPPRYSRPIPQWLTELEDVLRSVLEQTYQALYADMLILAVFGARTAIDIVITKIIGDVGGFTDKLKRMVDEKHISESEKKLFDAVVEAGSAAAHRGYMPNGKILGKVIDILEVIITHKIIHPDQVLALSGEADKILAAIPKRVPRNKKEVK